MQRRNRLYVVWRRFSALKLSIKLFGSRYMGACGTFKSRCVQLMSWR